MEDFDQLWRAVLAPLLFWHIVAPESAWRVLEAWRFANPDAVRPSQAGYVVRRLAVLVGFVAVVVWASA